MKTRKMINLCLLISVCVVFCACGKTESESTKEDLKKQETSVDEKTEVEIDKQEENSIKENTEKTKDNSSNNQSSTEKNVADNNTQSTTTNTEKDKTNNQTNSNSNSNATNNKPNQEKHSHTYAKATCTKPQTCSCGSTKGSALGHAYASATCTTPKKCACGATSGNALGHNYDEEGVCIRCSTKDPNFAYPTLTSMDGRWTCVVSSSYNNGELTLIDFCFNTNVISVFYDLGEEWATGECCNKDRQCFTWKGVHYYFAGEGTPFEEKGYTYSENGADITIYDSANNRIKLQRISKYKIKLISVDENFKFAFGCELPTSVVNAVFTYESINQ